jgi:hypothetical protein
MLNEKRISFEILLLSEWKRRAAKRESGERIVFLPAMMLVEKK